MSDTNSSIPENLTRQEANQAAIALDTLLDDATAHPQAAIALNLSHIKAIDSAGSAVLNRFARRAHMLQRPIHLSGMHPSVARTLQLLPSCPGDNAANHASQGTKQHAIAAQLSILLQYLLLCSDLGWFFVAGLLKKRGIHWQRVEQEMIFMGSQALEIVGLIAVLIGGIVALQSADQLRQFGANVFVADLLGISITRELGPLMTAIAVAGRSGSAIAAEIATMATTEEIDALRTMGINPVRFVVLPKVIAINMTQPLLTTLAVVLAIFSGFLVAVLYLDVTPGAFINRLQIALQSKDIMTGLFKSLLFGNLIVTIGAFCGLRTKGGADAVGRSTTSSVVTAIFSIVVTDAICSLVFYFGNA